MVKKTKLGAFLIPVWTIKNDLEPAIQSGINVLMVASHCTEAILPNNILNML